MRLDQRFWMVWNMARSAPTVAHPTLESAEREAKRLARLNSGQRFYVCQGLRYFEKNDVATVELNVSEDDGIPF
jgi:hypothetical protein